MALNPPMYDALTPMAVPGEYFLLSRKGINFHLAMEGFPKLKAKGMVYVTTLRMVFVAAKPVRTQGIELTGFDIPLQLVGGEKFHQPIFGANYLSMSVAVSVVHVIFVTHDLAWSSVILAVIGWPPLWFELVDRSFDPVN
jgi:hypothetical protein